MTKRRAVLIILSIALVALVGSVTDYFLSLPPVQPEVDSGFRTEDLPLVAEVVCLLGGRQISPCGDGATVEILFHFECPDVSSVVARAFVISGESMRWIQKVEVHQESDLCSARMLLGRLWIGHSTVLNIGVFLRVPGNGIDRALRFYGRPDNQAIEIAWRGSEAT